MSDLIQQFIDFKVSEGKSKHTIKNYEVQLRRYEKGSNAIKDNKGKHNKYILNTNEYLKELKKKAKTGEMKRNTFKTHSMIIKSFLSYVENEEPFPLVPEVNYSKLFMFLVDDKKERKIMSKNQTDTLKEALKDEKMPYRLIFRLALMRGLRRSEILSIRHCDISAYTDEVQVLRKGKKERQPIRISSDMYIELRNYSDETIRTEIIDGVRTGRDKELVFSINANYLTSKAKTLTEKILGEEFLMHEFRHTAINNYILMLAQEGLSKTEAVIEAAEFAGHSDPSVTIQNYFNAEISNNFERLRTNDRLSRFLDTQ